MRVDLDPRVVGQCGQPGRLRREARLDPGIRLERQAVLDRVARHTELVEGHEVRVPQGQQFAQLAQLVGRAGRDHDSGPAADRARRSPPDG